MRKNRKGSVSIEASISFTVTLILLSSIISAISFYRTDILMRRSVEQTCEKMSLIYPMSIPATDVLSTAVNAFPDLGIGDTKGADIVSKVVSLGVGIDLKSGHSLEEMILQGLLSKTMEEQIRSAYIERNGGSDFFVPEDIDVFFVINDRHHVIEVVTDYSVVTIVGKKTRSIYSVIPLYGDPSLLLQNEESKKTQKTDDIWSLNNFDRGDAFRERYGANLPKTFPVIDSVDGGNVTAIRSIDLTSPYYQDTAHIEKKIKSDIKSLQDFEPQSATINGQKYVVDHINSRHLKVIIPKNSGAIGKESIEELKGYALIHGVILDIREDSESQKYSN